MELHEIDQKLNDLAAAMEAERAIAAERFSGLDKLVQERIAATAAQQFVDRQTFLDAKRQADEYNEALLKRCDEWEAKFAALGAADPKAKVSQHRAMFQRFIVNENDDVVREYMRSAEYRDLSEGIATEGGFLVDPVTESEIIKGAVNMSPLRSVARVYTLTGSNELRLRKRTSRPTAYWTAEGVASTNSSSAYGRVSIPVHQLSVETLSSREFLADVQGSESEMTSDAAEEIARAEGAAYVSGSGITRPEGFITNADVPVIAGVDAATNELNGDDFYALSIGNGSTVGLQEKYRRNARFAMNSNTLRTALLLKDGMGNYLWNLQMGLAAGIPNLIAGLPFIILEDMDDIADTAKPLACGDWYEGYAIVDRSGIEVLRDPFTAKPDVEFTWYCRRGGGVRQPEAIRVLQL